MGTAKIMCPCCGEMHEPDISEEGTKFRCPACRFEWFPP